MDEHASQYTVLARRFRPQTFDEVVGQAHVAQALRNAIQAGRVAHAYLFTGARGVGKTSMSRILAKSLNCPHVQEAIPCNNCEICQTISAGHDVDVLEIDGASNRGIDDIRSLRANVNVKSMRTKYKIYIIDEVHMLTKEAFNALLKTLEEPPANVKFVFCTTEPNKVPDTILSRCQRFDFSTIETANIVTRLGQIAEAEGIETEPEALEIVARRANGSMRDSQSLFDQLLAFGGERITPDDVNRLLGTAGDERLIQLVASLIERRRETVLENFHQALSEGIQLGEFTDQLLNYFRDLMVVASGAETVPLSSVSETSRKQLTEQAQQWGLQTIVAALQILSETKSRMARVSYARALAELALIRISLLEDLDALPQLIEQMKAGPNGTAIPKPSSPSGPKQRLSPRGNGPSQGSSGTQKPSSPEKKSRLNPQKPSDQHNSDIQEPPKMEFREGCENELWSQVVNSINDMLKNHVQAVSSTAISGPNQLDLTFPKSYHFSKQYCERPEVLGRLQKLVGQLTGRSIQIRLLVDEESDSEQSNSSTTEEKPVKRRPLDAENDPFVQQALSVFEGTIVKVDDLPTSSKNEE